jgi:hypothetical protein
MKQTVVALFNNYRDAERAVDAAFHSGFDRDSVSIMATPNPSHETTPAPEGRNVSPVVGAAVGGIAGAVLGLTALAIPGVGALVAAGPLAAALSATGAAAGAGGLAGLLTGLGISEDDADFYARGVYNGGAVVVVHTDDARAERAENTLREFGPASIKSPASVAHPAATHSDVVQSPAGDALAFETVSDEPHKTESGPEYFAPDNPHYSSSFDEFAGVFPRSNSVFLGSRGEDYESHKRAYDFGYRMATDNRFAYKDWVDAEPELRSEWMRDNGNWDLARDAVQQGWEAARGMG